MLPPQRRPPARCDCPCALRVICLLVGASPATLACLLMRATETTRSAVDRLKSINAELQAEIAQVVRSLSIAIDSLPTQLEEAASYDDPSSISTSTRRRRSSSSTSSAAEAAARLGSHEPEPCSPVYHQPPDVAHAILSCSVPHPGALCCTKTSVTEMEGAFIVDMSTTAR